MILDLINKTYKYTIMLALIGMFIAWAFGLNNSFVETRNINGMQILVFNWYNYQNNLTNTWSTNALQFEDILLNRQWVEIHGNITQGQFWEDLGNNLAFLFDCLYFPINFILWLDRWLCWIARLGLALIGWDFTIVNGVYNSMLVRILTWCIQNLFIPYI